MHQVTLTQDERSKLQQIVSQGMEKARDITRARILLKADKNGPAWPDKTIMQAFDISRTTIYRVRKQFCEQGVEKAVRRKHHGRTRAKKFDAHSEARTIALLQGPPPAGRVRWTIRLLRNQLIELQIFEEISRETVRKHLKKLNLNLV